MSPAHATGAQHPQLAIAARCRVRCWRIWSCQSPSELPSTWTSSDGTATGHQWRGPGKSKNLREKKQEFDGDMIGI